MSADRLESVDPTRVESTDHDKLINSDETAKQSLGMENGGLAFPKVSGGKRPKSFVQLLKELMQK